MTSTLKTLVGHPHRSLFHEGNGHDRCKEGGEAEVHGWIFSEIDGKGIKHNSNHASNNYIVDPPPPLQCQRLLLILDPKSGSFCAPYHLHNSCQTQQFESSMHGIHCCDHKQTQN